MDGTIAEPNAGNSQSPYACPRNRVPKRLSKEHGKFREESPAGQLSETGFRKALGGPASFGWEAAELLRIRCLQAERRGPVYISRAKRI